jgi:cytidyltransferase-like protein
MSKEPARISNYRLAKENHDGELPWVRVEDFAKLHLKRPVVLVNGCFDLLHAGHWKTIFHARKHGKTVVIAMDSDRLVGEKKPGRPIMTWVERATALGYTPADYLVEIDNDKEFLRLVELLKPDLRVKGAEYREEASRIPEVPCLFIHESGMRTSEVIRRIKNANG